MTSIHEVLESSSSTLEQPQKLSNNKNELKNYLDSEESSFNSIKYKKDKKDKELFQFLSGQSYYDVVLKYEYY